MPATPITTKALLSASDGAFNLYLECATCQSGVRVYSLQLPASVAFLVGSVPSAMQSAEIPGTYLCQSCQEGAAK